MVSLLFALAVGHCHRSAPTGAVAGGVGGGVCNGINPATALGRPLGPHLEVIVSGGAVGVLDVVHCIAVSLAIVWLVADHRSKHDRRRDGSTMSLAVTVAEMFAILWLGGQSMSGVTETVMVGGAVSAASDST